MELQRQVPPRSEPAGISDIVLPLSSIHHEQLALVGGKGANLGELVNAGFPVPQGFCITTVAYEYVAAEAGLEAVLEAHARSAADPQALVALASVARTYLERATIAEPIASSIADAYRIMCEDGLSCPVAVRSSATAEDLPFASFAGQQESFLNVVGIQAVLDAVRLCWASLWTERAVQYRAKLGLDQRGVRLAVVVQRMIAAEVAGVLFTANPVTGKRRQAVIDANPGLGEAVVSGATNPDHYVVNTPRGEIVERSISDKRVVIRGTAGGGTTRTEGGADLGKACLSDAQIRELAQMGARVEAHYAAPQDIEWAIDDAGKLWLTQSRPITTLYPLPANAPDNDDKLRVYFSLNVFQGVFGPITPMGISTFRLLGLVPSSLFGLVLRDPFAGPGVLVDAGFRLFIDITTALRTRLGRTLALGAMGFGEARSRMLAQQVTADSRLSLRPLPRWRVFRAASSLAMNTRMPFSFFRALFKPSAAVGRMQRARAELEALRTSSLASTLTNPSERLQALERLLIQRASALFRMFPPILAAGLGSFGLANRLLRGLATVDELQTVLRALPHNPTTQMDLELWALSQRVATDAAAARHVKETAPEQLMREYRAGALPAPLQQGLTDFLHHYGHRNVAEIDLGLPRWREDPTHILGVLANYLQLADPALAPDVQFRRGAQAAEAMVTELTRRATRKGRVRGLLVGFFLRRARALSGLREMPKFCLIVLLAYMREVLQTIGKELTEAGRLEEGDDIFFLTLQETHAAIAGDDMRAIVRERRAGYEHESQRRHVPRVLLSDGTEPTAPMSNDAAAQGILRGTPASPGSVTGRARVILDPTGAHLEPGEILVAPSTDPGWTPLFLTAGGLVMEMGGTISHGAVVAREYGIPAVVGVAGATEHISTGQHIAVDGTAGTVRIEAAP